MKRAINLSICLLLLTGPGSRLCRAEPRGDPMSSEQPSPPLEQPKQKTAPSVAIKAASEKLVRGSTGSQPLTCAAVATVSDLSTIASAGVSACSAG